MAADAASSPVGVFIAGAFGGAPATWPIRLFDTIIRAYYGVYEFTDDPACIFRVGLSRAHGSVSLSDGTQIRVGELVGTLHFWNEHLPRYSTKGPSLGWARIMHDRVLYSLRALADYVENDAGWREVRAVRAQAALSTRLGSSQVRRVAERYGFERVPTNPSLPRRLHALGESFTLWGLTRAFNPAALPRQPFLRDHHELWISRASLLRRYARRHRRTVIGSARRRCA
jgi:YkoP-like protein